MKKFLFLLCVFGTSSLTQLYSQTDNSSSTSTSSTNSSTTTATEYCRFLNRYAVHDAGSLLGVFSDYDTWTISNSINKCGIQADNGECHSYYTVIAGHEDDTIQLSALTQKVQDQFQEWKDNKPAHLTAPLMCKYLNDAIKCNDGYSNVFDYDKKAMRYSFTNATSQEIFNKLDSAASMITSNWCNSYATQQTGPLVSFAQSQLESDVDQNTTLDHSSAYLLSSGTQIINFSSSSKYLPMQPGSFGPSISDHNAPVAYVMATEENASLSADLSLEFDSLDGTQSFSIAL